MQPITDKRARKILFDTYWSGAGWKRTPTTSAADFAYAKSMGVMFDPVSLTHDELIEAILRLRNRIEPAKAARAFLASLSTRRLQWRSGLASIVVANRLSQHAYEPKASGWGLAPDGAVTVTGYNCGICNGRSEYRDIDLNVLNFERMKWGGVRFDQLPYIWLDLFLLERDGVGDPTDADIAILQAILSAIATSSSGDRPGELERRLSPLLPSSKNERHVLIEILAVAGILKARAAGEPIRGKTDWLFATHWRGEDRYDAGAVDRCFGAWLSSGH